MGWFFGFKLHIVVNNQGELMSFCLTKGNVDDRTVVKKLMANLNGLAVGDKGYLGQKLADDLQKQDLRFVTKVRKNMTLRVFTWNQRIEQTERAIQNGLKRGSTMVKNNTPT